jgi:hypothetical protein
MTDDETLLLRRATRRRLLGGLPRPPAWAARSVVEDGGVTHERVSRLRPRLAELGAFADSADDGLDRVAEVSVSVVDRPATGRWVRTPPTIQVEGGCFSVVEARRVVRAIEELIALVG